MHLDDPLDAVTSMLGGESGCQGRVGSTWVENLVHIYNL